MPLFPSSLLLLLPPASSTDTLVNKPSHTSFAHFFSLKICVFVSFIDFFLYIKTACMQNVECYMDFSAKTKANSRRLLDRGCRRRITTTIVL